ncbi:hypothetical protein JB92DRAFT_2834221 [Gautieria morchelliformis]|nr:hypothetical protein JB92DRAFT_2834221 [Gautieria morchelliformis]
MELPALDTFDEVEKMFAAAHKWEMASQRADSSGDGCVHCTIRFVFQRPSTNLGSSRPQFEEARFLQLRHGHQRELLGYPRKTLCLAYIAICMKGSITDDLGRAGNIGEEALGLPLNCAASTPSISNGIRHPTGAAPAYDDDMGGTASTRPSAYQRFRREPSITSIR